MIQVVLRRAVQGCTNLAAALRLATIQKADRIAVLDKGKLVEIGTHDALVAQSGVYAKLAALRFGAAPA